MVIIVIHFIIRPDGQHATSNEMLFIAYIDSQRAIDLFDFITGYPSEQIT